MNELEELLGEDEAWSLNEGDRDVDIALRRYIEAVRYLAAELRCAADTDEYKCYDGDDALAKAIAILKGEKL